MAPQRSHYLIRSHRKRDRLVKTLDDALNIANYDLISPKEGREILVEVDIAADKQWNTKFRKIIWSDKPPNSSKQPPENILRKERRMSNEAQAAVTPVQHWRCFFTNEILDKIVEHTNEKASTNLAKFTNQYNSMCLYTKRIHFYFQF